MQVVYREQVVAEDLVGRGQVAHIRPAEVGTRVASAAKLDGLGVVGKAGSIRRTTSLDRGGY